jgi:ABC-type transport system involved in multi-copper enzyme maturation permease subunit
VNPLVEIRLVAQREVVKSIRSLKGIILAVLTVLGALVVSVVCVMIEGSQRAEAGAMSNEAFAAFKEQAFSKETGDAALAAHLASQPWSLIVFLKITIWLGPLLIALLGFDAIAAELQHRSVRFWTVRTRRTSFYLGKFLGLFALVSAITFTINLLAGTVVLVRGYVTIEQLVTSGLRYWLISLPIALVWAAIASFVSSRFRTPILALLTTFGVFFMLWLVGLGGFIERLRASFAAQQALPMSWYEYLYPNAYDDMLLSTQPVKVLTAIAILVGFAAVLGAAGSFLFARRDV